MLINKNIPLEDRIAYSNTFITSFGTSMEALFMFNMIVGDSVVIWRAWVLWTGDRIRKIMIVPVVLLLVSLVFAIIDINCLVDDSYESKSTIPSGSRTCRWAEPISWAISLLTNIAATALIAAKAWSREHRQLLRTGIGRSGTRSKGEKILILLVESGFVYCLFWLTQLLDFFDIPRATGGVFYLYLVVSTMGDQISGLYPTLIIILVKLQQSVHDDTIYMSQFRASAEISTSTRFTGIDKTRSTHAVETLALDSYHGTMPHESEYGEGWRSVV
ncbi:hypothetical protein CPB85DRAFT_1223662 [Mucidula mucida]|nr:hypothetical protein CPB85DRAFT_1223662 [Mucidula mucida]